MGVYNYTHNRKTPVRAYIRLYSLAMAEIRAIEKVGLAEEVRKQKLEEAQAISEAVLDAEVKIGELMAKVPKATGGQPFQRRSTLDSSVQSRPQTKADIIEKAGFTPKQVQRFETLAKNLDIVEQAKAEARENDDAGAEPKTYIFDTALLYMPVKPVEAP